MKKLHLGCGRNILEGWLNLDSRRMPGVDIVADLDRCSQVPLPLEDDSVDEFLASHVIEHLVNPLPFMEELYRIAKPDSKAVFRLPYGSSDDAFEDPTHVRQFFLNSFGYFPALYWRADYGYRGDWATQSITLWWMPKPRWASLAANHDRVHTCATWSGNGGRAARGRCCGAAGVCRRTIVRISWPDFLGRGDRC